MDNDQYGHVNNVVYYSYFDTAVNGFLIEASGCDVRELPAIGIVAETSCKFMSELSFPDTVYAGLALERLGNSSVVYRIGLFRNQSTEPAAIGRFVHVYVDSTTRRPVPIPLAGARGAADAPGRLRRVWGAALNAALPSRCRNARVTAR